MLLGLVTWRTPAVLATVGLGLALFALSLTWRPAIDPIPVPSAQSFPAAQVTRGAVLAGIGDCVVCHTADGGRPFAGSRALPTPFGVLYSNNLTPDGETGIGHWSAEAFRRAMRDGVARDGVLLYPALPYSHFTHTTDADLDAIYAFLMSRRPAHTVAPPNRLIPPLGFRPLLAGWNLMFLRKGMIGTDPARSPAWNRGRYLAEGLGHCGACHTPLNPAGGEETWKAYGGGVAEGWRAPPLNASNPAAIAWTTGALFTYLKTGISPNHTVAGGPMGPVIDDLASIPDADVWAIATYIGYKMAVRRAAAPERPQTDRAAVVAQAQGATLFAGACGGCHGEGAPMLGQQRPSLAVVSSLRDKDPESAIQAVLSGVDPPVAGRGPLMPGFGSNLTDAQVAAVLTYVRERYTGQAAWPRLESAVRKARKESPEPWP